MPRDILMHILLCAWDVRSFTAERLARTCHSMRAAFLARKTRPSLRHLWYKKKDKLHFSHGIFAARDAILVGVDAKDGIVEFGRCENREREMIVMSMDYLTQAAILRE